MQRIAAFLVRRRTIIFGIVVLLAAVCAMLIPSSTINKDMTKYLPQSLQMKQGMDISNEEFGESTVFNLMVMGVPNDQREDLASSLEDFDCVSSVTYEADDSRYNNGDAALYQVVADCNAYSSEAEKTLSVIEEACESRGYTDYYVDNEGLDSATNGLLPILVAAVVIAMVILFVLATSWLEPLLLLLTIILAVAINMGTNIIFDSVSETTFSISAILQMALSMDYLIMLLNRFRREKAVEGTTSEAAMERAITGGITAIASSSVTTIVGLLCLVLMSFTIGRDLGIVLAKGVFLSLVCAFACMPFLVLSLEYYLDRTAKRSFSPSMRGLGRFSYKLRVPLTILFAVVLIVGFSQRNVASIDFVTQSKNPDLATIQESFDLESQIMVVYGSNQEEVAEGLVENLESTEGVSSVSSYGNTIGEQRTTAKMAEENDMDEGLVQLIYYDYYKDGKTGSATKDELVSYLRGGMARQMGSDYVDSDTQDSLDSLADVVEDELVDGRSYYEEEAQDALSSHPSIHSDTLHLVYLGFCSSRDADPAWTMTTDQLVTFMNDSVLNDPAFDSVLDDKARTGIEESVETVDAARDNFIGTSHDRIIVNTTLEPGSTQMDQLCDSLRSLLDGTSLSGGYYLVGQGPMAQEMAAAYPSEFNFLSIVTILAIFVIVLVTFRNLLVPVLLVALIQSAFCWDMVVTAIMGRSIYYLAQLVVQSILMGAAIDYAILLTTNYRESRLKLPAKEAVVEALHNSIRTVSMSGSILVFVCLCLGIAASGITGEVCLIISIGAAVAAALVLVVLPGTLTCLDRLVAPKNRLKS